MQFSIFLALLPALVLPAPPPSSPSAAAFAPVRCHTFAPDCRRCPRCPRCTRPCRCRSAAAAKSYCFIVLLWLHAINVVLLRRFYCTSTYAYVSYRIYFYLRLQLILRCHVVYIVP